MKNIDIEKLKQVLASEKTNFSPEDRAVIEEVINSNKPSKGLLERITKIILKYLIFEFFDTD